MDWFTFGFLFQDGLTSAAVYALIAFALVLIFSVTRVIFIGIGEFLSFAALTVAAIQSNWFPPTVYLLMAFGVLTWLNEAVRVFARGDEQAGRILLLAGLKYLAGPLLLAAVTWLYLSASGSPWLDGLLALLIIVPLGAMLYKVVYQPVAKATVLVLLILSVALHFALLGLGLLMFGPEGARTQPLVGGLYMIGSVPVPGQAFVVGGLTLILIAALWYFFTRTLAGKSLQATAINGRGAQLVGVGTSEAGRMAFMMGIGLSAICGILISPISTIAYDTGFLIALKGFVASIIGGLFSFPMAAVGALLVGMLEAFSAYWASAYKEIIVFTLIIPVLLWQSLSGKHH